MAHHQKEAAIGALAGLLGEFRKGRIADPELEREGLERHARQLSDEWGRRFPGFPHQYFPFTSFRGEYYRGRRDAYLKKIIVRLLGPGNENGKLIVNPACVLGRHARDLALRMRSVRVIATDIDPNGNWIYQHILRAPTPDNFEFVQDSVFAPQVSVTPTAVVFFGACGPVSDGAIDYATGSRARYLICRTCCHDNIGGNTTITRRPAYINWFFRFKNWGFRRMRKMTKYDGFYFSDKYSRSAYPRSQIARGITDSAEFMEVATNSTDSDICRAIIDLDRCLLLMERGFRVWYWGELFVAERAA